MKIGFWTVKFSYYYFKFFGRLLTMSFSAGQWVLNTHSQFGQAVFAIFAHSVLGVAMHTRTPRSLANVCLDSYVSSSGYPKLSLQNI